MNKVILKANLTKDPEVRYSQTANGNFAIARFSVAVNRKFKKDGEPEADFFTCTALGRLGELVEKYLRKGSKIVLCGQVQNDNYKKQDGTMVYGTRILVDEIDFCESKASSDNGSKPQDAPRPVDADGFMNIPDGIDEELPFN